MQTIEENKEEKITVMELKERFDVFSQIETIEVLREKFLPKIVSFTELVASLEASHEQMREIIR